MSNLDIDDGDPPAPVRRAIAKPKAKNKGGRPSKDAKERAKAAAEAAARLAAAPRRMAPRDLGLNREPRQTREMARETSRPGAVVVEGRNGEMLTRRRTETGADPFELPKGEIPDGWDYQWNRVAVVGDTGLADTVKMHANGWRPVPADRHPGRWFEPGYTGEIVINGLRLEERPLSLSKEAKREDELAARKLMRDQTDALKLTQKLPDGFSDAKNYRGAGVNGRVKMAIDANLTLPEAGNYEEAAD
jgi:hypothetical protein